MRGMIQELVGANQTTFILGRKIGDNILLAQEIFRNYHRNSGTPRCGIKVDIKKAYDHVRGDILFMVLEVVGFPLRFVRWIEEYITKTRFSIKVNSCLFGFFPGEKGLC